MLHETFGNFAFAIACRVLSLRDIGPALSPFNAFLILTGIETLPLRMQRHCDNAKAVAEWLAKHPKVAWVSYPGLAGDRYHALAQKYVPKGAGAVFTFGLKGGYDAGVKLVSNVKLFSHLANIGDTRSLIIHPASTTHRQLSDAQKVQAGAGPDVVRLSIGLEDKDDIIADLEQGLAGVACSIRIVPQSPFVPAKAGTQGNAFGVCRSGSPLSRGRTETSYELSATDLNARGGRSALLQRALDIVPDAVERVVRAPDLHDGRRRCARPSRSSRSSDGWRVCRLDSAKAAGDSAASVFAAATARSIRCVGLRHLVDHAAAERVVRQ